MTRMKYPKIEKAIIPAAGYGTRFLPATKAMPKEMLTILDKPVIQYVVEELVAAGIKKIIVITGWSKRAIEDHFDNNNELEQRLLDSGKKDLYEQVRGLAHMADIAFIRQGEMLGTGHAITCAKPYIGENEPFLVHWGDSVIFSKVPVAKQLVDVWEEYQKPVMAMERVDDKKKMGSYGMFVGKPINGRLYEMEKIVEKPKVEEVTSNLATNTEFILTPQFFEEMKSIKPRASGEYVHVDAIVPQAKKGGVLGLIYEGKRFDLGDKFEWLIANTEVGLARADVAEKYREYLEKRLASLSPIPDGTVKI